MRIEIKKVFIFGFFVCILCAFKIQSVNNISAITYVLNGGRLGDDLVNYSKAKYLALEYGLDFYYLPFKYSDSFKICELDKVYRPAMEKDFRTICKFCEKAVKIDSDFRTVCKSCEGAVKIDRGSSCFYVSSYYASIFVDWTDKRFISELKKAISPRFEMKKPNFPKGKISVALHIRKGGGFDDPIFSDQKAINNGRADGQFIDKVFPLKFPPDSYYIEQIKKLYEIVDKAPLYIYIFTDDPSPIRIVEKYKKSLDGLDIEFDYRKSGNSHNSNVVEDFFTMMRFDCLIRNGSNFSFMVDMIGDFFVVIALEEAHWDGDNWVASDIKVKINNDKMPILIKNRT